MDMGVWYLEGDVLVFFMQCSFSIVKTSSL